MSVRERLWLAVNMQRRGAYDIFVALYEKHARERWAEEVKQNRKLRLNAGQLSGECGSSYEANECFVGNSQ